MAGTQTKGIGMLLNLYFICKHDDIVLRDPRITHLPLHLHPRVSLHGPSHGHSGHKTEISNSYTSFMVFPSVSLFSSQLSLTLYCISVIFLLLCRGLAFFALCHVNHSKMFALLSVVVPPPLFCFLSLFQLSLCYLFLFFTLCLSGQTISSKSYPWHSSTHIDRIM